MKLKWMEGSEHSFLNCVHWGLLFKSWRIYSQPSLSLSVNVAGLLNFDCMITLINKCCGYFCKYLLTCAQQMHLYRHIGVGPKLGQILAPTRDKSGTFLSHFGAQSHSIGGVPDIPAFISQLKFLFIVEFIDSDAYFVPCKKRLLYCK